MRKGASVRHCTRWLILRTGPKRKRLFTTGSCRAPPRCPLSWYHAGAFLPHDVAPDNSVELEIAMRAPSAPGNFVLQFDMVSEHLAWFEDLGSEVLRHQLIVK